MLFYRSPNYYINFKLRIDLKAYLLLGLSSKSVLHAPLRLHFGRWNFFLAFGITSPRRSALKLVYLFTYTFLVLFCNFLNCFTFLFSVSLTINCYFFFLEFCEHIDTLHTNAPHRVFTQAVFVEVIWRINGDFHRIKNVKLGASHGSWNMVSLSQLILDSLQAAFW